MNSLLPLRHRILAPVLAPLLVANFGFAFSPYEQYLMSGKVTHVGLIAAVTAEQHGAFTQEFGKFREPVIEQKLTEAGITNLKAFTRKIEGTQYAVLYFTYTGGKDYLGAAAAFERATKSIDWARVTTAHPRATTYGRQWLQMEWINFIRGLNVDRAPTSTRMIGTTIIHSKEFQYRTLHQTTWPGVVDQVARGNTRNLNIFLVELDGRLVEFLYLEYMGTDQTADDAANQADPINQRWWKLTDACQKPFSDVEEGMWAALDQIE